MFSVNDTVRYGTAGVCRIDRTQTRVVGGEEETYYVLRPVHDARSTVYVPVNNPTLAGRMMPVLSRSQVMAIIQSLPGLPDCWIPDDQERKRRYRESFVSADRQTMAAVIKTLYERLLALREHGKRLRVDDERCLREAERLLYDEFSLALDMAPEEVPTFIRNQLGQ